MNATLQRVAELKAAGEDHQWYPTTDEIIKVVVEDIKHPKQFKRDNPDEEDIDYDYYRYDCYRRDKSVLDIGAGDGRVLLAISEAMDDSWFKLYAIEKATVHLQNMPKHITVLGTEFIEQTLVDKEVYVVFSNPPYADYEQWAIKIIREANAKFVYLVIPRRWRESVDVAAAIKIRGAEVHPLGEFDFLEADRRARAKVEVLRVEYGHRSKSGFDAAIEDMLPELEIFDRDEDLPECNDRVDISSLTQGGDNLVQSMVMAYDSELSALIDSYRQIVKIDVKLLKELGVDKASIVEGVRAKIVGLKNKYWKSLFDEMSSVTQRLATKQRKSFLESLTSKTGIDFTESNIYAMLLHITKVANDYFDEQVVDLFRDLSSSCNVAKYKSNQKTWKDNGWRYNSNWSDRDDRTHYKLEYRLVVSHGGVDSGWSSRNGLSERAFDFLKDCVTVANNLRFVCTCDGPQSHRWTSGKSVDLLLDNDEILVNVRAFQNQNMHMKFNQRLILAINVEAGRLLGWLKSPKEACEELQATGEDAEFIHETFGSSFRIAPNNVLRLSCNHDVEPVGQGCGDAFVVPPVPTDIPPIPMGAG